MTCEFNVYVSMSSVKLDDLLVGYFGIILKKKKISLINFSQVTRLFASLSNKCSRQKVRILIG